MKAMIFAAGLGTRLKPITDTIPKALVSVNGKTLLEIVIEKLKSHGIEEIVVNVHHHADKIIDYLAEKNNFGIKIDISDERELLLDTGGGLKKASTFFNGDEPILIHNVDILSDANLDELCNVHCKSGNIATLLVSKRSSSRQLFFNDNLRLKGWKNMKTGETKSPCNHFYEYLYNSYAFSGIHIVSPEIFSYMNEFPEKFPIMDFYLKMANQIGIGAYVCNNLRLLDVGKIDSLKQAEEFVFPSI